MPPPTLNSEEPVLCHRILAGTPAQGRVDHLHHHTPVTLSKSPHNPGSQHSDHTGVSVEHRTTLMPSNR